MEFQLERLIPPVPSITRGVPLTLGADPKGIFLLYTNRKSVVLRNVKDFCHNDMCVQHVKNALCAKYSPSGYYIASADELGKVVIWDTVNPEHIVRNEFTPYAGPINDMAWTADNRRLIVGGKGQSKCAGVYNSETGSNISALVGVGTMVHSVDIRPTKPPRAIVGDKEGLVTYFEGSSYEFKHHIQNHTKCVNAVRFSPTGEHFVSAGSDGKIFLYRSEDGQTLGEVGSPAHKGTIYNIAFGKDGSRFVSSSADKSLKLWHIEGENATCLSHFQLPDVLSNMIQGCCWVGDTIAAVTYGGCIHLFDAPENLSELKPPRAVLFGHASGATCGCYDTKCGRLLTGASDGGVASWSLTEGLAKPFDSKGAHAGSIIGMVVAGDAMITVGLDDRCMLSVIADHSFGASVKLPSRPHSVGIMLEKMLVVVGCDAHIVLLSAADYKLNTLDEHAINLGKHHMAVSPKTGTAIVCTEKQCLTFKVCGNKLTKVELVNPPPSTPVMAAYSPDGSMIAFANIYHALTIHRVEDQQDPAHAPTLTLDYEDLTQRHTARVTAMAWSPDSKRIATAGLDTCVAVLTVGSKSKKIMLRNAHPKDYSISLSWTDNSSVCSVAPDGSIRCWKVANQ